MRAFVFAVAFAVFAAPAMAEDAFERLMLALRMDEVVEILSEEGRESALQLETNMFPQRGGVPWINEVDRIYDPVAQSAAFRTAMMPMIAGADMAALLDFFESDRGQQIVALEVSARRAFIDPQMEELARDLFKDAPTSDATLHEQVVAFIEVNDLVAQNVDGAFRSNVSFAMGAHDAGAFADLNLDQLVSRMWQGEEDARAQIGSWLYGFLMTAYRPLDEEDLNAYLALSTTDAGQQLNSAIIGAFDALFTDISFDLGHAAGRFAAQQDL